MDIVIRGARTHYLKDITVRIPKNALTVITGLSGSGKSSLAFDTLYSEGQRRYIDSLSTYARQFLPRPPKADVESIEGLSPAIAVEQKTMGNHPRSTVGTITEIYDYLRLLFARAGIPHSPTTGQPITALTSSQISDRILNLPPRTKVYVVAPIVRHRKGDLRQDIEDLRRQGFQRLEINGMLFDEEDILPTLNKNQHHSLSVIVDRLTVNPSDQTRVAEAVETCLRLSSEGLVEVRLHEGPTHVYSTRWTCPESGFCVPDLEPRLFSFNSPIGACPRCDGLGETLFFDPDLIVDAQKSLREGALKPWLWGKNLSPPGQSFLEKAVRWLKVDAATSFAQLSPNMQRILLYGDESIPEIEGVVPYLERRWRELQAPSQLWKKEKALALLKQFQSSKPCQECTGLRLRPEALCVRLAGYNIGQICQVPLEELSSWCTQVRQTLTAQQTPVCLPVLQEIEARTAFLVNVGVGYLNLARSSGTLSGGESQRLRLATHLGSGLTGVIYVLDEPSIGLHQRDHARLIQQLHHLRDRGNTVVVVEHDNDTILQSDYVIDLGPQAGRYGGHVVACGTPQDIMQQEESLTGAYLSGKRGIPVPTSRRPFTRTLRLEKAYLHNLKDLTVEIPLGIFVGITGVSGCGKSTLIMETLLPCLDAAVKGRPFPLGLCQGLEGMEHIDKVIHIDQSPIGRTPRSNPATYSGVMTPLREWFALLPEAKSRGYSPGRFSFNIKGGRCEACQGDGVVHVPMHFLPDVYVTCDVCQGQRYDRETLAVTYKGLSIADVLNLSVDEALPLFDNVPTIKRPLELLHKVGLGYLQLGQRATTLSGGEAQRLKLACELRQRSTGKTVYVFDEPTTGLHTHDTRGLLDILHHFVNQGNTVIVIEHHLDVLKTADWIIDLGPEGGHAGGQLIAAGTPEEVTLNPLSHTGRYLKNLLPRATP